MNIKEINEEIFYTKDLITKVDSEVVTFLKKKASQNQRKRVRLCLHNDVKDALHEMVVVFPKGGYARPHKHLQKSESLHVIEGSFKVIIFNDDGSILEIISMGNYISNEKFYYRLSGDYFHTVIPTTDFAVYHETTNGPFQRKDLDYASWSPAEDDYESQVLYLNNLAEMIKKRQVQ